MRHSGTQAEKNRRNAAGAFFQTFFVLFLALLFAARIAQAGAPPIADTPCDEDYYQSLSARAWLEAQREITQNQNLILKPDSVLEYTCFDLYLRELAQHAEDMLSETKKFGAPLDANSMDDALNDLVGTALMNYIKENYETGNPDYDLLGGHPAAQGIDHVPAKIVGGAYSCEIMGRVWQAAKCINFISDPKEDGFYTFDEYAAQDDKRHLAPERCGPVHKQRFNDNIQAAFLNPVWTHDPVVTYLENIDPANCAVLDPIPTGIKVVRS